MLKNIVHEYKMKIKKREKRALNNIFYVEIWENTHTHKFIINNNFFFIHFYILPQNAMKTKLYCDHD